MLPFVKSAYFQDLLDGYPESVVIFNTDGYAYACNQRARDLFGFSRDEDFKGRLWDELLPGIDDHIAYRAYMNDAHNHQEGRRPPLEAGYTLNNGVRLRLSLTTSLLVEYSKIFGILLSMTDVTHIYAMHERQRRYLEERHAMEQQRTRSLTQLSDAVAHQLRNPAMAIAGFARIAMRKSGNDSLCEYLDGILEETVRLESIVRAVASFNAIHPSQPRRILLKELVARAVDMVLKQGPEKWSAIPLIIDVEETAVTVDVDLTTSMLAELATNALDAVASIRKPDSNPGEVYIGAGVENGVRYEVADTGPGIDPDFLPFVFDPFFTTKPDGVGMGLTRARRMASELGLDITLQRGQNGGVLVILSENDDDSEIV
ncbi:MAG: ATP-binding protein [Oceanidesulfovibrio sp.]